MSGKSWTIVLILLGLIVVGSIKPPRRSQLQLTDGEAQTILEEGIHAASWSNASQPANCGLIIRNLRAVAGLDPATNNPVLISRAMEAIGQLHYDDERCYPEDAYKAYIWLELAAKTNIHNRTADRAANSVYSRYGLTVDEMLAASRTVDSLVARGMIPDD